MKSRFERGRADSSFPLNAITGGSIATFSSGGTEVEIPLKASVLGTRPYGSMSGSEADIKRPACCP